MKQVTIPAQWLQELIALCGPEDHELRERVMKSAAPAPVDALATGRQAQAHAVEQEPFGYFKAEPFGWTDCGPDDEGAVALYERPQAQADARDAEQERWMGIGKAIERACVDLPAGAEINIHLEKDAGTVTLSDCDGDEQENFPTDEGFAGVVNAAIDAAIAAAKGE